MKESTHGGNVYAFREQMADRQKTILDFSANINPMGPEPHAYRAALDAFPSIIHYPDPQNTDLYKVVTHKWKLPSDMILFGNGAAELLYVAIYGSQCKHILVPAPGFSEYEEAGLAYGLQAQYFSIDVKNTNVYQRINYEEIDTVLSRIGEATIVCLGNPNNPDGSLVDPDKVAFLARKYSDCLFLIDESFIEFTDQKTSMQPYCKDLDNLFVLHSFTKCYAVPGLRLGMLLGKASVLNQWAKQVPSWTVNRLAQVYGAAAIGQDEYIQKSRLYIDKERQYLYESLQAESVISMCQGSVNYLLGQLQGVWQNQLARLQSGLAKSGILIRSCQAYRGLGQGWFRVAVKRHEDNKILVACLHEILTT